MLSQISEAPEVDELSRGALLAEFERIRKLAFRPLSTLGPREFAESIMRGPGEHGSTQDFKFFPYQVEPYEEIFNPRNQEVVLQWFSRGGKSRLILTALGYVIMERPCPIGVMWPVEGDARLWSKDEFMTGLVDPNPALSSVVQSAFGQRKSSQTMLHKEFPGGSITMVGGNAPGRLRRMKARFLYGDEIDAHSESETDEGDIMAIFKKRGSEFADVIEIYASYPSLKGRSRIEAKLEKSDDRRWFTHCAICGGEPYVMHRSQLRYDDGPENARLECPRCKGRLNDAQRYEMMMTGHWRATRPFLGRAGFHANSLLWPHPVDPAKFPGGYLHKLAQEEIDVENSDNPERSRRVLVNTVDAETFEGEAEKKPEHTKLFLRREKYDPTVMLPAGVLWIGFGCDVQGDRLELEFVGFGADGHTWGLGYHVLRGTPLVPPTQGVWSELDRLVTGATFPHPSGKTLRVSAGLVDRGYKPDNTLAFTRAKHGDIAIYGSRGSTMLSTPLVQRKPKFEGNPKAKVWILGSDEGKSVWYQRLERDNLAANGYVHHPEMGCYGEGYFKMFLSEDSQLERCPRDGKFYRKFYFPSKSKTNRNEALDIRVMALAIERIKKPNYAALALEFAVKDQASATPAAILTGQSSAAIPLPSSPAQPARPRSFVHVPRRSGWVTGGRRW